MSYSNFNIETYLKNIQQKKLIGSFCNGCGKVHLPPRGICRSCRSSDMGWKKLKGHGQILGWTSITIGLPNMREFRESFGGEYPYTTGVVYLDEGTGISAPIETKNTKVGSLVKAHFIDHQLGDKSTVHLVFKGI